MQFSYPIKEPQQEHSNKRVKKDTLSKDWEPQKPYPIIKRKLHDGLEIRIFSLQQRRYLTGSPPSFVKYLLLENKLHVAAPLCNILYQEYVLLPIYVVMCWPVHFVYQKLINRVTRTKPYWWKQCANLQTSPKLTCGKKSFGLEYEATIRDKSIGTFLQIKCFRAEKTLISSIANSLTCNQTGATLITWLQLWKEGRDEVGQITLEGREFFFEGGQYLNYYFCPCL